MVLTFGPHGTTRALYYTTYNGGGEIHRRGVHREDNHCPRGASLPPLPHKERATFGCLRRQPHQRSRRRHAQLRLGFRRGSRAPTSARTRRHLHRGRATPRRYGSGTAAAARARATVRSTPAIRRPWPAIDADLGQALARRRADHAPRQRLGRRGRRLAGRLVALGGETPSQHALHPSGRPHHGNNDTASTVPAPEDIDATTNSYLEIILTAIDSEVDSRPRSARTCAPTWSPDLRKPERPQARGAGRQITSPSTSRPGRATPSRSRRPSSGTPVASSGASPRGRTAARPSTRSAPGRPRRPTPPPSRSRSAARAWAPPSCYSASAWSSCGAAGCRGAGCGAEPAAHPLPGA